MSSDDSLVISDCDECGARFVYLPLPPLCEDCMEDEYLRSISEVEILYGAHKARIHHDGSEAARIPLDRLSEAVQVDDKHVVFTEGDDDDPSFVVFTEALKEAYLDAIQEYVGSEDVQPY